MLEYNPALDGLRAMAVIAVMLFHAKVPGVLVGFLGVDVFFVLSGYLITRIIHEKRRLHAFSFTDFYRKRAVRILPPLFVAACFTALLALAVGESVSETRIVSALLFYTNIDLAMNYSRALFAHSWSLSLEEQFYLVWPITLMVILRFAKTPSTWVFILYVGAVLWRGYLVVAGLEWIDIYYRPDTRLSGLLLGSALGLGLYRANVTPKLAFAALLVLLFCFHQAEWREMSVFYTSLPAVEISTALIIISLCSSRGAIYRLLSKRVLVKIGILSYSMYLFHYPIMRVASEELSTLWLFPLATAVTLALSEGCRVLVERPIQNRFGGQRDSAMRAKSPISQERRSQGS